MNKVQLSAVIITFNEERNIERCLLSLQGVADDIVVVDSFSTDKTEEICKKYNATFIRHAWEGYSKSKNFGNSKAKYDFIFSVDADEEISAELKKSILKIKANPAADAYKINRLTNYCGKWIRHCGWYPDSKLRLWNRNSAEWQGEIHEELRLNQNVKTGVLDGDLLHYSYTDIDDHLQRANKYTTLMAQNYFRKNKKFSCIKLIFSPQIRFFKDYILQQGWRDGWRGLTICCIAAFSTFIKYAKLREIQHLHANGKPDNNNI